MLTFFRNIASCIRCNDFYRYIFFFQSNFDHVDNVFSFKWIFHFAVLIRQSFITWKNYYIVDFMKKSIFRFFRNSFDRSDNKFFSFKRFVEKKSFENVFIMQNNRFIYDVWKQRGRYDWKKWKKKKTKNFSKRFFFEIHEFEISMKNVLMIFYIYEAWSIKMRQIASNEIKFWRHDWCCYAKKDF